MGNLKGCEEKEGIIHSSSGSGSSGVVGGGPFTFHPYDSDWGNLVWLEDEGKIREVKKELIFKFAPPPSLSLSSSTPEGPILFRGWWRNEKPETNDNFIHNYQSVYTTKETPIRAAQETYVEKYGWSTDVKSFLASFNGFTLRQNNKETKI